MALEDGENLGNPNNEGNRLSRLGFSGSQKLSPRQKNIVNPFAQEDSPPGYILEDDRNRWVIAGIQDSYLNFGYFPKQGKRLVVLENSPITNQNNVITREDLLTYLALYPQNGRLQDERGTITAKSPREAYSSFANLVNRLSSSSQLSLYTSPSSHEAQLPQNQGAISTDEASESEILSQNIAQLVAIPYVHGRSKLSQLRETFGNPEYSATEEHVESISDPSKDILPFNPEDADFEDWRNNAPPGSFSPKIYYNFKDGFYYFIKRTNSVTNEDYDTGRLDHSQTNIATAIRAGIKGILKFSSKYTESMWDQLSTGRYPDIVFVSYKDERPNSRWIYSVRIPKSLLDDIESTSGTSSLYIDEMGPYTKSQLIIDGNKNNTTLHMVFKEDYFTDNTQSLISVLRHYHDLLKLQGLEDGKLDGINLSLEMGRIKGIISDISNLISLSGISSQGDINIDFCLSDLMNINYAVINGTLYTRFMGQNLFTPISSDELEDEINLSAINVFSRQSSASIGYWYSTPGQNGIFKNTKGRKQKDWLPWVEFLQLYHKPTPTIDPNVIDQAKKSTSPTAAFLGETPPPKLFETLSQITANSPTPSGNPEFASFLQGNLALLDLEKSISKAAGGCDTPLAGLTRDLHFISKYLRGKISTDALIAKAVNELRTQLIEKNIKLFQTPPGEEPSPLVKTLRDDIGLPQDPLDPIYVQAAQGNYGQLHGKIENYVNRVIACLLPFDDIQASLKKQLRQSSVPPDLENLIMHTTNPPVTIKISKTPYRKNTLEKFWKLIEEYAVRFIKQLILGFFVQMLEALLGCGPEDPDANVQELARRIQLYGFIDLNNFIEGVEVERIATSVGLLNRTIEFKREELLNRPYKTLTVTSDPRLEQLEQFHNDLSAITTPEEIKSLLRGEATEKLLQIILEMIEAGNINISQLLEKYPAANGQVLIRDQGPNQPPRQIPIGQIEGTGAFSFDNLLGRAYPLIGQPELRIITNEFQDSLKQGDPRYAALGFTKERLINYFKQVGKELGTPTVHSLTTDPPQLPIQSYCPDPQPTFDFLSDLQIQSQLAEEIVATKKKISDLCEVNDGMFEGFGKMWDDIEMPEELKQFLAYLRSIGDAINKYLSELFSDDSLLSQEGPGGQPEKLCENFVRTLFWQQVGNNSWKEARLGSELASNFLAQSQEQSLTYETPIGIPLMELTEEQQAQIPEHVRNWYIAGEPSLAELNAELVRLNNELAIATEIVNRPIVGGGNDPASLARQAQAQMQQQMARFRAQALISHIAAVQVFIDNYDEIEDFVDDPEGIDFVLKYPNLELVMSENKATIYERKIPGGRTFLAEAEFEINLDPSAFIEPHEEAFDRTIYENFEAEPYPDSGRTPPNSTPVTLRQLRDPAGNPSGRLLTVLNRAREEMGMDAMVGEPALFIPSLLNEWVKTSITETLTNVSDAIPIAGEPSPRDALTSINHIEFEHVGIDVGMDVPAVLAEPLDFYLQLCHIFYKPQVGARNPLGPAMQIINQIPLIETPDRCADVSLARSMMQCLQSRIAPFLINILPLMRTYKAFNNPTTLNLLSDYLRRRIQEDFTQRRLNGIFEENIDGLFLLYQKDFSEGRSVYNSINLNTFNRLVDVGEDRKQMDLAYETYDFKLQYIIKKYLGATFWQWASYSLNDNYPHLWAYQENFYDPSGNAVDLHIPYNTYQDYETLCRQFFLALEQNEDITDLQLEAFRPLVGDVTSLAQQTAIAQIGSYYFPAPAMLATYAIVHDHLIHPSKSFHLYQSVINSQKRIDNRLKSIVNPSYIPETSELTY
jgi:hypothetical protein